MYPYTAIYSCIQLEVYSEQLVKQCNNWVQIRTGKQDGVLSRGGPRDAAVNFGTYTASKFTAASRGFHCDSNAI